MKATDQFSRSFQRSQIMRTDTGYIHRYDPAEHNKQTQKKQPSNHVREENAIRNGACYLTQQQKEALKNHIAHILMKPSHEIYLTVSSEMITDKRGNKMSFNSFAQLVSSIRAECGMSKGRVRNDIFKLAKQGKSREEIIQLFKGRVRLDYLREVLLEAGFERPQHKSKIITELARIGLSVDEIQEKTGFVRDTVRATIRRMQMKEHANAGE